MSSVILVADDDPFNLRLLQELCEAAGYKVRSAADGGELLVVVARERPDLVLLDLDMPVRSGFDVLRIMKGDRDLMDIPVIVVTATGDVEAREKGIELGAEDYVTKPFRVFEIQQRIRNALRLKNAETQIRTSQSPDVIDPLTKAGTSQQLLISADYEYTRASRYDHPLTCVVVQVANMSGLSESMGQEGVDGVLVQLAAGLRSCIRGVDHMFRSDLGEFTLLLPETDRKGADVVLERIRHRHKSAELWAANIDPVPQLRLGAAALYTDQARDGNDLLSTALANCRRAPLE
ncbi:MAG: response regulator [Myxococcota bacterium]